MGMFDSFYLKAKCPHCGETNEIEFQTKQFSCNMFSWRQGDTFNYEGMELITGIVKGIYGGCRSKECTEYEKIKNLNLIGFGRILYCDVLIENRIVKGAINIRKEDE